MDAFADKQGLFEGEGAWLSPLVTRPRSTAAAAADAARQTSIRKSYLLANAYGFRVESRGGRLGVVEDLLVDDAGKLEALRVVGGTFRVRSRVIPADEVTAIDPRRRTVQVLDRRT